MNEKKMTIKEIESLFAKTDMTAEAVAVFRTDTRAAVGRGAPGRARGRDGRRRREGR